MNGSPGERKTFSEAVVRSRQAVKSKGAYAELGLRQDGSCRFLTEEKQCTLHSEYGPGVLPDVCASYPRVAQRVGDRIELSGRLSCPEVARLCLLADDALELDSLEPSLLAGHRVRHAPVELNPEQPYQAAFAAVRELAVLLLQIRSYPLSSRLFFIGSLALRTDPHSHELQVLGREIERLSDPRALEQLHGQLAEATTADHGTMYIVGRSLMDLLNAAKHPTLRRVITRAFASYAGVAPDAIEAEETPESSLSVKEAQSAYVERRQAYAALRDRIERYFENYALNYFMTEPHVRSPSLMNHLEKLLMRMVILHVLLIGHPELHQAFMESDRQTTFTTLDRSVVETVYSFCRGIEHDPGCVASMHGAWEDVPSPDRLYRLLEFLG